MWFKKKDYIKANVTIYWSDPRPIEETIEVRCPRTNRAICYNLDWVNNAPEGEFAKICNDITRVSHKNLNTKLIEKLIERYYSVSSFHNVHNNTYVIAVTSYNLEDTKESIEKEVERLQDEILKTEYGKTINE